MSAASQQLKALRKQIGRKLKVRLPSGEVVPAWQLWAASVQSNDPGAEYLPSETHRIEALYEAHAPEVPVKERRRRALRMALKLAAFEVMGLDGDAADLRILALANGLSLGEFSEVVVDGEPVLGLSADAMRQLGASPGDSTAVH